MLARPTLPQILTEGDPVTTTGSSSWAVRGPYDGATAPRQPVRAAGANLPLPVLRDTVHDLESEIVTVCLGDGQALAIYSTRD